MIGPAEIEDMMSDYTEALAKAGQDRPSEILVWPLRARAAAGLAGEKSAEVGIEPQAETPDGV